MKVIKSTELEEKCGLYMKSSQEPVQATRSCIVQGLLELIEMCCK